jgi:MFS family permease
MAMIGDNFPLAVWQVAMSRYIGATLTGQIVGVSVGGMITERLGWRGVFGRARARLANPPRNPSRMGPHHPA